MKHIKIFTILSIFSAAQVLAAGYEKNIIFSGKHAGLAGATASSISGSESLAFNPAGLATSENSDVTLNFSPTFSKFKAPLYTADTEVGGKRTFAPVFGLTAAYKLMPKLGIGIGYYVAGGAYADYGDQDLTDKGFTAVKPNYSSKITISEFSLGAGYELIPGLSLGAAWRVNFVKAYYNTGSVSSTSALALHYTGLSDTTYNGMRLGLQWLPEDARYGLGLAWRSNIQFKAEGDVSGELETVLAPGTKSTLVGSKASFKNNFPQQIAIGGHFDLMKDFRVYSEYVWSEYSRDQRIEATGTLDTSTGTAVLRSNGIEQNWKNQHNVRFAVAYTGLPWAIRGGYVYTSQVTDKQRPAPTFSVPSHANTFALGTGSQFMDDKLSVDAALEYSFASGETDEAGSKNGKYSNNAYAVHTGVSYKF